MTSKGPATGPGVIPREDKKNRACLVTFYDCIFSRAYSAVLESVGLVLSLN